MKHKYCLLTKVEANELEFEERVDKLDNDMDRVSGILTDLGD